MRRTVLIGLGMLVAAIMAGLLFLWVNQGKTLPHRTRADTRPQVAATVNGVAITQEMIDKEITVSRFNVSQPLPPLTGDDLNRAADEALNQLVTRQLVLQATIRQNFVLDEAMIESRVELLFGANNWATWCPSCISEMPDYEQVYQQHGGPAGDFVVLGVNLQEGRAYVEDYAVGLGLTFPVLLDEDGRVTTRQYQVTGMPGSFIIDRQGVIFYRHLGPMNVETLRAKLAELGL